MGSNNIIKKDRDIFKRMILFPLLSIFCGLVIVLLSLEIILNFFPVNEGLRLAPLNDKQPFLHFEPNRVSIWSKGGNFFLVNKRVRSNNYGFINDQDYDHKASSPLLAVIGDSNVEAVMVPYSETTQGRLAKSVDGFGRVYSFGVSGSALSDYLSLAEYANKIFKPDGMIFVIISNDFCGPLPDKSRGAEGHYYFFKGPDTKEVTLGRVDYNPGLLRRALRNSKLFMYLIVNVRALQSIKLLFKPRQSYVSTIDIAKDEKTISESKIAINVFFKQLPRMSGLDHSKIIFIVDGVREVIYEPAKELDSEQHYFSITRNYFIDEAKALGYEVIDMQKAFAEHYKIYKKRFEYLADRHWNGLGHAVAADQMIKSNLWRQLFRQ